MWFVAGPDFLGRMGIIGKVHRSKFVEFLVCWNPIGHTDTTAKLQNNTLMLAILSEQNRGKEIWGFWQVIFIAPCPTLEITDTLAKSPSSNWQARYSCSVGGTLLKCLVKSPALVHAGSCFGVTVANCHPFIPYIVSGVSSGGASSTICQITNSNVRYPQAPCARDLWKGTPPFLSVLVQSTTDTDHPRPAERPKSCNLFLVYRYKCTPFTAQSVCTWTLTCEPLWFTHLIFNNLWCKTIWSLTFKLAS